MLYKCLQRCVLFTRFPRIFSSQKPVRTLVFSATTPCSSFGLYPRAFKMVGATCLVETRCGYCLFCNFGLLTKHATFLYDTSFVSSLYRAADVIELTGRHH